MNDGEAAWIARARGGDHQAFRRLVEAHARALHRVCFRILGDTAAAEDAVQDALLNAYRALDRFDGRSAFATWLHRIAVNAALASRRSRRAGVALGTGADDDAPLETLVADTAPGPVDLAASAEIGGRVQRALAALTPLERSAFVLRHVENYPMDEIAGALDSNVNACKQAVFRAVKKLRGALAGA
jgi:RNA polymerase sigma-70 factor (ECF subfamily)